MAVSVLNNVFPLDILSFRTVMISFSLPLGNLCVQHYKYDKNMKENK